MYLRKIAKILGISPPYLSLLLNAKRPWRRNLKERYLELVNTFVNTQEANTTITNGTSEYSYLKSGGAEGIRTTALLLAKPITRPRLKSRKYLRLLSKQKESLGPFSGNRACGSQATYQGIFLRRGIQQV